MADAAVEFLLGNLKQLLVYNVNLIASLKDEVDWLCNDLHLLAAFVKEATESRSKDAVVKELLRQIRLVVYKAEDIVDEYVVYEYVHNSRTNFGKSIRTPDHHVQLIRVGEEIKKIRGGVKEIYDKKLFANEAFNKSVSFTRCPPSVEEDNVVGFDEEAKKVAGWLKDKTDELEVMSVVGMGGLGKTTLVKKVYNDSSIQYEFHIRSWVYVSQVYSRKEVFLKILYDVTRENKDMSQLSVDTIADELRRQLKDGKYLIVLDDVWTKKPGMI